MPENARAGPGANQPENALRGLCKTFGDMVVLDGFDLEVGTGESVVVSGRSGVGKSVTLKCLPGMLRPDAGRVTIDGKARSAPARAGDLPGTVGGAWRAHPGGERRARPARSRSTGSSAR